MIMSAASNSILSTVSEIDFMINHMDDYVAHQARKAERAVAEVERRAVLMCANSLGKKFRVRPSKTSVVGGTIVKAELAGTRQSQNSVSGQFRIVMACGESGVEREFVVDSLPQ